MKAISHSLTGVIATSLLISSDPRYLVTGSIVALFPDLDTSSSTLGRVYPFRFIAEYLEKRYPHRSLTHSFLMTGLITLLTAPLALIDPLLWQTISLAYFIGWFGDVFTKSGVCAFYPSQARLVIPGNPRLRLATNSPAEYWLIGIFALILSLCLYIANLGSITNAFNSLLGLPSGAVEQIRKDVGNYILTAQVKGYNNISQERVNGEFEVVELITANDFIGICRDYSCEDKVYRIGISQDAHIIISKIVVKREKPITQVIKQVEIEEDDIIDYLDIEDNGRTYVTGNLIIEDADELIIPKRADVYNPITVQLTADNYGLVKIKSATLKECQEYFRDFIGSGFLVIRSIR